MRSALVKVSTGIVENVIVANPQVDPAPEGYILVALSDDSQVSIGWVYTGGSNFTGPTA